MSKVINFPLKKRISKEVFDLKMLSDRLDKVIIDSIAVQSLPAYEVAGIISHRLGALLKNIEQKDQLWEVCEKLLKQQASIK